jgi:hypothetical protein
MDITYQYHIDLNCCPFCGGVAWLRHEKFTDGDVWYNPQCSKCPAGLFENFEWMDEAVEAWNRRKENK